MSDRKRAALDLFSDVFSARNPTKEQDLDKFFEMFAEKGKKIKDYHGDYTTVFLGTTNDQISRTT